MQNQPVGEKKSSPLKKEEEKHRPSESFKLKKAFAESSQKYEARKTAVVEEKQLKLEARTPFDAEGIETALDEYIRLHQLQTMVAVALKAHRPEISGEEITIEVDNNLQMEHLEALKIGVQNHLIRKLNNGGITLHFRLFEPGSGKEEKKLITAQDKLEHFIKLNPVVEEMRKRFGLQFE